MVQTVFSCYTFLMRSRDTYTFTIVPWKFLFLLAIPFMAYRLGAWMGVSRSTFYIFATNFLSVFIEAAPFLLIGTIVSGLMEVFVKPEWLTRLIPRNRLAASIVGAFMGFLFPVCECGVVPVVRQLLRKGVPLSVGITFLLAAPVMNPVVLASTYMAFGFGPVLIGRFIISAFVAIIVGLLLSRQERAQRVPFSAKPTIQMPQGNRKAQPASLSARLHKALCHAGDEFFEMGFYLIIGSLIASVLQTGIPSGFFFTLAQGTVISVLIMQLLAFILSICSTVDAFVALAYAGTFTTGSILAFLTFGPMVDIKSTLMFSTIFSRKKVIALILLPLIFTMVTGILVNILGIS